MYRNKPLKNAKAVLTAFSSTYGQDDTKLQGWQNLCTDVGVEVGGSITQCKKNLKRVHINIVDFVAARRLGQVPTHFGSKDSLRFYIQNTPGKLFPLKLAKQNGFLRALLFKVY